MIPLELMRDFERQMKAMRIGDTPLRRLQKIERRLGTRRLYIKLEGENPTGTHKDRMALLLTIRAQKAGFGTIAAATCGNYGASLLHVCDKLGVQCKIYIPTEFEGTRSAEIANAGGKIVKVDGNYESAIVTCARDCAVNRWYNANPGGGNHELGIYSYSYIAKEVAQSIGRQPDWVSVPVGNGTLIGGVWRGFRSIGMKPRMLGTSNNNSAVRGLVLGQRTQVDVPDLQITEMNEPLAGNFLADPEEAIAAVLDSGGAAMEIPDPELLEASHMVKVEEGLDILPACAGTVSAIGKLDSRNHVFVAVFSGRGHTG